MIKPRTGLAGVLDRVASVTRLIRPAPAVPPPSFTRCAGCGKGSRNDQQVPDPDQFAKVKTTDGTPGTEKAEGDIKLTDAAPVYCSCGRWYHAIRCYSLHRHH